MMPSQMVSSRNELMREAAQKSRLLKINNKGDDRGVGAYSRVPNTQNSRSIEEIARNTGFKPALAEGAWRSLSKL